MAGNLQFLDDPSQPLIYSDFDVRGGPKGDVTHFRVTCSSLAKLVNYYNYILTFGASVTFRGVDNGHDRMLEVELPGLSSTTVGVLSEWFFDQWELLTNELNDTIFANPLLVGGAYPLLNYNDKTVLSKLTLNGGTPIGTLNECNADRTTSGGTLVPPPGGTFTMPSSAPARQLCLEILKGQTEYMRPSYVLRHTSYCAPGVTYNSNIDGEMKIYGVAALLSEIAGGWTYNCPHRLLSKISQIPVQYAPVEESPWYYWGWIKKITREPVLANFMIEVSCEYELGLWSVLRYAVR